MTIGKYENIQYINIFEQFVSCECTGLFSCAGLYVCSEKNWEDPTPWLILKVYASRR